MFSEENISYFHHKLQQVYAFVFGPPEEYWLSSGSPALDFIVSHILAYLTPVMVLLLPLLISVIATTTSFAASINGCYISYFLSSESTRFLSFCLLILSFTSDTM